MPYEDLPDNPIFTALGKFAAQFAFLFNKMEEATTWFFKNIDWDHQLLIYQITGERHANDILRAYVRVFNQRWKGVLTKEYEKLLKQFSKEVGDLITLRNRLMHDSWSVVDEKSNAHYTRARRSDEQYEHVSVEISLDSMKAHLETLHRLTDVMAQLWDHVSNEANKAREPWGDPLYTIQQPRLHEFLKIQDGKIKPKRPWPIYQHETITEE